MFFPIAITVLAICAFVGWLISEWYGDRKVRITLGLVSIVLISFLVLGLGGLALELQRMRMTGFTRAALEEMRILMEKKDYARVEMALAKYHEVYYRDDDGGSEKAASEMFQMLRVNSQ